MYLDPAKLLVLLVVALIVLGPERLPKAVRRVVELINELKKLSAVVHSQLNEMTDVGTNRDRSSDENLGSDNSGTHSEQANSGPTGPAERPSTEGFRLIDGTGRTGRTGDTGGDIDAFDPPGATFDPPNTFGEAPHP